ncbi:MAG: hypothetical protein ACRC1P_02955 [Cellulosilyticaceae bacterium]
MDIKWTYILIVAIYLVLASIKVLNVILRNKFKQDKQLLIFKGFRKDFFTSIAQICVIVTIIINGMTIVGGRPLNVDSIIITLLVVGMAIISGSVMILVETGTVLNISGYEFKKTDIKEVKVKSKNNYSVYDVHFTEDINGYENLKLYVVGNNKDLLKEELNKFVN